MRRDNPTFDFIVNLPVAELEALQAWKDEYGVNSRSKAMRILCALGINLFPRHKVPSEKAQVALVIKLPSEVVERLGQLRQQSGNTLSEEAVIQLTQALRSA